MTDASDGETLDEENWEEISGDLLDQVRDAIIKENPVKSGFLQIRGGGFGDHPIQIFYM